MRCASDRMMLRAASLALLFAGAASAEPQVYRLSDADRAAAIAAGANRPEAPGSALLPPALPDDPDRERVLSHSLYPDDAPARDNRVHGEVGTFIGSGGAAGFFGTIGTPLGNDGFAQFSFDTGRYPTRSLQPYRWNMPR